MEEQLGKKADQPKDEQGSEGEPQQGSQKGENEGSGAEKRKNSTNAKQGKDGQPGAKNGQSVQEGDTEVDTGELFEIFKKQQRLRNALQDLLDKKGLSGNGNNLLDAMDKIEQNLINQGVTEKTLGQMTALKHQLLKLEKAVQQQGEDTKRVSSTNTAQRFVAPTPSEETIKQYFNTIEILNRQSLPLRQGFKKKVQDYFKIKDD